MRKIVACICLIVVMSLTACGNSNTSEIAELRQRVELLESELEKYQVSEADEEDAEYEEVAKEVDTTASEEENSEIGGTSEREKEILSYLDEQVKSDDYDNLTEVAMCDEATEKHLIAIAEKCVEKGYVDLSRKVIDNKAMTPKVMKVLTQSDEYDIWKLISLSEKSDEEVLIVVAEKCAEAGYADLAKKLIDNKATTGKVMRALANSDEYDIWKLVALSEKSDEQALIVVAEKCAESGYVKLSQKVIDNKATTGKVTKALANSKEYDILELVALSEKSDEESLAIIAGKCVECRYVRLAEKVSNNPNTTTDILKIFVNAKDSKIVSIGHQAIEKRGA